MAMAYAASQRSSCEKRKVGAVIVDELGTVISSGFNEVPRLDTPCRGKYGECYRDKIRERFFDLVKDQLPELGEKQDKLKRLFRQEFRILDLCRALHAEDNAILNLARTGRSAPLDKCTLYTTTYPCRLCANRIADVGIRRIVYLEPYPDSEAKVILRSSGVSDEFFVGVTFNAYFRLYGEEK